MRLWVNGQLLIDNWIDQAVTTRTSAAVALVGGSRYDVRMEYYEHTGSAVGEAAVDVSGQAQVVIPETQLYPPANRAPAANAGTDKAVTLPSTAIVDRKRDRRRTAVSTGAAVYDLEPRERSGHGDVLEPEHAEYDGDISRSRAPTCCA